MQRMSIAVVLAALAALVPVAAAEASPRIEMAFGVTLDAIPRGPIGSIERLRPGDTVFIEAQAVNRGLGAARDVVADVFVNDVLLARVPLGSLGRGQRNSLSVPWVPPAEGAYTVRVVLDPESRNSRAADRPSRERVARCDVRFLPADSPTVAAPAPVAAPAAVPSPQADLKFLGAIHVMPHPRNGRSSLISAWIENAGSAPTEATTVEFHVAGVRLATRSLPPTKPGQRTPISVLWNPEQPGERHLRLVLDPENRIPESNESNNEVDRSLLVHER